MNRLMLCNFALLLSATSPSFAQEAGHTFTVFNTTWVPSAVCNPDIAEHVELSELARHPDNWAGACVSVRGYKLGAALFSDPEDAVEEDAGWSDALIDRRVGLYARRGLTDSPEDREPDATLVVGQVGTCEQYLGEFHSMSGYCHSSRGAFIALMDTEDREEGSRSEE